MQRRQNQSMHSISLWVFLFVCLFSFGFCLSSCCVLWWLSRRTSSYFPLHTHYFILFITQTQSLPLCHTYNNTRTHPHTTQTTQTSRPPRTMQRQQGEEGAAGASEDSSSGRAKTENIWDEANFVLFDLDMKKVDVATVDKALSQSRLKGPMALIEMRMFAAEAAGANRRDMVAYLIEQRKVPVNTVTDEEWWMIETESECKTELERKGKQSAHTTPLYRALLGGSQEMITYLLDRMDKREVDTRTAEGCTCLMVAAREGDLEAVKRLVLEFDARIGVVSSATLHKRRFALPSVQGRSQ